MIRCLKSTFALAILLQSFNLVFSQSSPITSWIRINQLGYTPGGNKVAVYASKSVGVIDSFRLVDATSNNIVFKGAASENFGSYGPFLSTNRLDFSAFTKTGTYFLEANGIRSPMFKVDATVYQGAANFCLQYMRQQRSGFNPFLKDSCHTHDGYTMYGPMPDSTHIDVSGGWHDASDYLQYASTSANATWHLLAAYRDFKKFFPDGHEANGLTGKNGYSDLLDEANWGLQWLTKMNPSSNIMFNQLADDRDHQSFRLPKLDSFYGKGFERPVYFITGEPQGLFKYKNRTKGTSSTAAKFASAFALAKSLQLKDPKFSEIKTPDFLKKAVDAWTYALKKPGVTQTAPGRAPYFYEEDNWVDDMELAAASIQSILPGIARQKEAQQFKQEAYRYAQQEKITPWLGADTARHYQFYPFINAGHYELAQQLAGPGRDTLVQYYRDGIEKVWRKAKANAFYRGVPFIWCSNNFTTSFAMQCNWYRKLSGSQAYAMLEQANFDWLFGCNPWGTSMVYGLPADGDFPTDPHSAFTHLKNFAINGGLVDGPVNTSIYKNLIGIQLHEPDEYAEFQSDLAVYHDDYGDYSTNEPTMDGTASLIYLLASREAGAAKEGNEIHKGAINRGSKNAKEIALVFTGHEFADGVPMIEKILNQKKIKASFFLTGDFYRNQAQHNFLKRMQSKGHYLGPHSDKHLLYCDWQQRDSLLVNKAAFAADLSANVDAMRNAGIVYDHEYFLPPYEWYNDSIAQWTQALGMQLINFTPGTFSTSDYTWPGLKNYRNNETIFKSIKDAVTMKETGLNGFLLLFHVGVDPRRKEPFYRRLTDLIAYLTAKGYVFKTVNELL